MNYTFESYLNKVKDKNIKRHYMQESAEGNKKIFLESKDEYEEYVNYLIESKKIDVNSLTFEEQILLAKDPEMFLEFLGMGWIKDKAKSLVKGTVQGVKAIGTAIDYGLSKIPGVNKAWAVVKNISKAMMLKMKEFVLKSASVVLKLYRTMMKKKWFAMLMTFILGVAIKFLSVLSIIKALITGAFGPKGETTKKIQQLIRDSLKKNKKQLIRDSLKKNKKQQIENKTAIERNETEQEENTKERKKLFGTQEETSSFKNDINYGALFFEFREYLNKDLDVYNEDVYFYNEITQTQLPKQAVVSTMPAGTTEFNYFQLKIKGIPGDPVNIGVDIKNNSIYGFMSDGSGYDDLELKEFLDGVFGPGKTITGNQYKWKKGEWKKIFAAIETEEVKGSGASTGSSSGGKSTPTPAPAPTGSPSGSSSKKKKVSTPPPMDEEDDMEEDSMEDSDGGDSVSGRRNKFNKLNVSGNKNNIYVNDRGGDDYGDEDINPAKVNNPNRGFWHWMSINGGTLISGILIGIALTFIGFHVWTAWASMSAQLASQSAQLAQLATGQNTILSAIKKIPKGISIVAGAGSQIAVGNGTITQTMGQAVLKSTEALVAAAPHM